MPLLGVAVAVIRDGRVLLARRVDLGVWCLPGGAVAEGESVAQTAAREVQEEFGLDVRLMRLVGVYSQPRWAAGGCHDVLFAARVRGGGPRPRPDVAREAAFFALDALPEPLLWWHRRLAADALAAARGGGRAWSLGNTWPFAAERRVVVAQARRDPEVAERLRDALIRPSAEGERLECPQRSTRRPA